MTDTITATELRFERTLPAPVETVWRYLTESDLRARWFMGGEIDPRVGGKMEFVFDHDRLSDDPAAKMPERFAVNHGKSWTEDIVRIEPPHVLAFTFGVGSDTIATFELKPIDGGTLLTLVHSGIKNRDQAANFGGGWTSHLAVLEAKLNGGGVPDFWALHKVCEAKVAAELTDA